VRFAPFSPNEAKAAPSVARLGLLVLVIMTAALGACSKPKSFIVLDLRSADTSEIHDVTEVVVKVSQEPSFSTTLTYPPKDGKPLVINQSNTNDLSVSFTGARSGAVKIEVSVRNAGGCELGVGQPFTTYIKQGSITSDTVYLQRRPTCSTPDGGATDAQESDVTFPGCDPVPPTCAAGQTCQVNCTTESAECTAGGTHTAGQACTSNKDCAPGTQCFNYASVGCDVKICLRFCDRDAVCAPARDGGTDGGNPDAGADGPASLGVGTRSVCQGPVNCGTIQTAYHTCTVACDPRLAAVGAKTTGCPAGLACLVVGSMDQVDCSCAETTRTKTDGMDCQDGSECAPGYICNIMGGTKTCRAVCRCDAVNGVCAAANECAGGKACTALQNETTFGVCL
jgi:hypothetical protein